MLISCSGQFDQKEILRNKNVYKNAVELGDWDVARMATFNLLSIDNNNHDYYDTLAMLYFKTEDFLPALKSCERALQFNENKKTVGLAFECSRILKQYEDMVRYGTYMEKIKGLEIDQKYQLAFALFQQNQYKEALVYLSSILTDMKSESTLYREYNGKIVQEVPYKACAYNLIGFIHNKSLKYEEAAQMFRLAIEVFPDYQLAQDNLNMLSQLKSNVKTY
jgi:tetratricopeptide (TPR) repeat protein